ncbi:hypothetical protein SBA4_720011 [Candidatus Sulfopaludibacter sp. SbA4]|nr:hypothetical protein SBA4_720011 [Candidatus Sulfopaludibacter sp. SbA4]
MVPQNPVSRSPYFPLSADARKRSSASTASQGFDQFGKELGAQGGRAEYTPVATYYETG